jgi:hypothetical protein
VTDLVHWLRAVAPSVKPVRKIDHERIALADVFVSVNNPGWHGYKNRVSLAHAMHLVRFRLSRPVLPKVKLILSVEKEKTIRLISMLMGTPSNARVSHREVTHCRVKAFRESIFPEELHKPTTGIGMLLE